MKVHFFVVLLSVLLVAEESGWRARVPEDWKAKKNPIAREKDAPKAGEKIYRHDCAQCHGEHAEGKTGKKFRPPLKSEAVKHTSDGELFWLLTNGSVAKGMPSWSELPEAERWQAIAYLRKLNK